MKKQLYKIEKCDWFVTVRTGSLTTACYFETQKEAKEYAKKRHGKIQLFKLSYEFKDAWVVE